MSLGRFFILSLFLGLGACGVPEEEEEGSTALGLLAEDSVQSDGVLFLNVTRVWENDDFANGAQSLGTCAISKDQSPGTNIDCNIEVPEGELFYSDLFITAGTADTARCPLIVFQPYFYQASNSATFLPLWRDSEIDCSGTSSPPPADCYNGPATTMIDSFPEFSASYFHTINRSKKSYEATSGNSNGRGSNRWTCNSLDPVKRNQTLVGNGDGYVARSMVDWRATCKDPFFDTLYSIRLNLKDRDSAGGDFPENEENHYADWDSLSDDPVESP